MPVFEFGQKNLEKLMHNARETLTAPAARTKVFASRQALVERP